LVKAFFQDLYSSVILKRYIKLIKISIYFLIFATIKDDADWAFAFG
tara:strand:- start:295 stop:432 length:138 start_codon:yes stop_codon:yes gene_type:complete